MQIIICFILNPIIIFIGGPFSYRVRILFYLFLVLSMKLIILTMIFVVPFIFIGYFSFTSLPNFVNNLFLNENVRIFNFLILILCFVII
jgi:hypothetical protein